MANFKPFRGWLPRVTEAADIVSRPFDQYSKEQAVAHIQKHPDSFLQVILPFALQLDAPEDPDERLKAGKDKFNQLVQQGVFTQSAQATYYVYRQTHANEHYVGVIGAISIDDCIAKIVKPHEQTIQHKEEKLKHYLDIVDINAEPVVISYKADHQINETIDQITQTPPSYHFEVEQTGIHELWPIANPNTVQFLQQRFEAIPELYIADGHHRTASSVLLGLEKRAANPNYTGNEAFNYFMAILFPHHQIRLREFNRFVKDLNGLSEPAFLHLLEKDFEVSDAFETLPDISSHNGCFGLYMHGKFWRLTLKKEVLAHVPEDESLPTQMLTNFILSPILAIHDLRTDRRIQFQGGKTDVNLIRQKVDSGACAAAFIVNKVTIPQFKKFADHGWFMPPKSTYFEPKLLNALVVYSLQGQL